MKITEEPSVTYKIRDLGQFGWADITIREWPGGGSFDCQSDYGNYAYQWGAIGSRTFKQFLCSLDKDYFLKKTRPKDYRVFDSDLTCQNIRRDIIEKRKEREFTKEEARECWNECEDLENQSNRNIDAFYYWFETTNLGEKLYCGDYSSVPIQKIYNPMCDAFWERIWPHITKYWKEKTNHDRPQNTPTSRHH